MNPYEALALELLHTLDHKRRVPPHEDISATMRGEMAVLRLLARENAAVTAGDLSRLLHMTTSRIAAVLGSLEKKQMILRQTDEDDKRRVLVTLTDKGSAFCQQRRQDVLRDTAALLEHLGQEDAEHFVRIIKRIQTFAPDHPPFMRGERKEENAHE